MSLTPNDHEKLRQLLCKLERHILECILEERAKHSTDQLAAISDQTAADVIYAIDRIADTAIHEWFQANWPADWPIEIIMEGLDDDTSLCFPQGSKLKDTKLVCIIDPIDGTRGIMYDKRAAWILAGIAPQRFEANRLRNIEVACMTEIPTTRQWRADQVSAIRGQGIKATILDVRNQYAESDSELQPSQASEVQHAFGTVIRFFPAGCTLLAQIEESLWDSVYNQPSDGTPLIFNDQYISTGGQFYEILSGHDRFIADLRPIAFRALDMEEHLTCHPYDVACALILEEAGCPLEHPDGSPLDCPLDTTSAVSWVAYANEDLATKIRPQLNKVLSKLT